MVDMTGALTGAAAQIDTSRESLINAVANASDSSTATDVANVGTIEGAKGSMEFTMGVMEAERKIDETAAVVTGIAQGNKTGNQKLANNIG